LQRGVVGGGDILDVHGLCRVVAGGQARVAAVGGQHAEVLRGGGVAGVLLDHGAVGRGGGAGVHAAAAAGVDQGVPGRLRDRVGGSGVARGAGAQPLEAVEEEGVLGGA